MTDEQKQVIELILEERDRQEQKWGEQNHPFAFYQTIFIEELGEVNRAYLENKRAEFLQELIQAAAVLVAIAESEFRVEKGILEREQNV